MAYKVIILYQLYMPSYFLGTFTEYPFLIFISDNRLLTVGTYRDNLHRYSQLLF